MGGKGIHKDWQQRACFPGKGKAEVSEASATLGSQLPESSHYPASSEPRESAQLVNAACGQCGQQHSQREETGSEQTQFLMHLQ